MANLDSILKSRDITLLKTVCLVKDKVFDKEKRYSYARHARYRPLEDPDGDIGAGDTLFSWAPKSLQMVTAAMKLKGTCSLEEKL